MTSLTESDLSCRAGVCRLSRCPAGILQEGSAAMSRSTLTALLTTAVVALSTASASAQVTFYDPGTWFAPSRPCQGPACNSAYGRRPVMAPNVYPNSGGSYYRGGYSPRLNSCPDDICGPRHCGNGRCGTVTPRSPVMPMPYDAPMPSTGYYRPEWSPTSRFDSMDRRVMPNNYEDDGWMANRSSQRPRSYDLQRSPFYP